MKKMIELGASIDAAICAADEYDGGYNFERDRKIRDALMALPPVDAVPVVHGEWVWVQYDANPEIGNFHCSKCRFIPAAFNMAKQYLNYCPNCGARMDGE